MRRAPANLATRGKRFWASMKSLEADGDFEFVEAETELIVEVCRFLDEIDALGQAIRKDGPITTGSRDQPRPHPALSEVRQHRLALGRLLAQLDLPEEAQIDSPATARARKAADSRWATHHKRKDTA